MAMGKKNGVVKANLEQMNSKMNSKEKPTTRPKPGGPVKPKPVKRGK